MIELMVVIAIIAILSAFAASMFSDYTTKTKLAAEISELSVIKSDVGEAIADNGNSSGDVSGISITSGLPTGTTISNMGVITITNNENLPSGASIMLTPSLGNGAINWNCTVSGMEESQLPNNCSVAT